MIPVGMSIESLHFLFRLLGDIMRGQKIIAFTRMALQGDIGIYLIYAAYETSWKSHTLQIAFYLLKDVIRGR